MRAKKSLGQHFLKSDRALKKIIEAAELDRKDFVLEIGPGTGILTKKLLETGASVVAVEKDDELFTLLEKTFAKEIEDKKLVLVHDDILDFEPRNYKLTAGNYKLVANIPYNITGEILRKFLESECAPGRIILLVQKEVAERILARDGKESILSVSVRAYGDAKIVDKVLAGSFVPRPSVDSAIIKIDNISKKFFENLEEKKVFEIVRVGFAFKRKKLKSNLIKKFGEEKVSSAFNKLGIEDGVRAEKIGVETWRKLALLLS